MRPRESRIRGATVEEVMWEKINELQEAREYNDGENFDEIVNSLEKLFRAFPKALEELMQVQEQLERVLYEERLRVFGEANRAPDVITRKNIIDGESEGLEWEYRNIYEEAIFDIMQKHDLIPMSRPHFTDMSTMSSRKKEQVDESSMKSENQSTKFTPMSFPSPPPQQQQSQSGEPLQQSKQEHQQQSVPIPPKQEKKKPKVSVKRKKSFRA